MIYKIIFTLAFGTGAGLGVNAAYLQHGKETALTMGLLSLIVWCIGMIEAKDFV